ncbi:hypothetical protein FGIG_04427 [Fasciola gigantica]|uniref:Uncharacterized protein n=1 Tax=Fasciola gigantica TaxID=46835 RepID=A0A504ZD15_FASGI|nr:hypothetical protein FGIG_04427 [Fasciola gigantica]
MVANLVQFWVLHVISVPFIGFDCFPLDQYRLSLRPHANMTYTLTNPCDQYTNTYTHR